MPLDLRTVLFMNACVLVVCAFLLGLTWRQAGSRTPGLGPWFAAFVVQALSVPLVALRPLLPPFMSVVVANGAILSGAALLNVGSAKFVGRKPRVLPDAIVLAVFLAVHSWFTLVSPDLRVRSLNVAAAMVLLCGRGAWVLARGGAGKPWARATAIVMAAFATLNAVRVAVYLARESFAADYLAPDPFEAAVQVTQLMLLGALASCVSLMTHAGTLSREREEREKAAMLFRVSPDPMLISRAEDGTIIDANDEFEATFGWPAAEIAGRSARELGLWEDPSRRESLRSELASSGRVRGAEVRMRRRNGETLTGLLSAETLAAGGETRYVTSFHDITERTRLADEVGALLRAKTLLLRETNHRVKNNLAAVQSFLALQAARAGDEAKEVLEEAGNRVRGMASLYDRLFRLEREVDLPLDEFLGPLLAEIMKTFSDADRVRLALSLDRRDVSLDLLPPVALIANELVTNAMKHAFPVGRPGTLSVASSGEEPRLVLEFSNDGIPLPEETPSGGFGLVLVRNLADQLGASFTIDRGPPTRFVLDIDPRRARD